MGVDFLAGIEPTALRERVRAAVYQACTEVIATDPQLAPAAYLHRGRVTLGLDEDAAVQDLQAAVSSQDGPVVYRAAVHLRRLGKPLAPMEHWRQWELPAGTPGRRDYEDARDRAGIGLHGGLKSHYTAEISAWSRASGTLLFTAHPYAILAWLHSRPRHTLALPALERFYAAAADLGYANPMPQVRQLLGQPQIDSSQIT